MASIGNTVVEHSHHQPKVVSLSLVVAAADTGKEKAAKIHNFLNSNVFC